MYGSSLTICPPYTYHLLQMGIYAAFVFSQALFSFFMGSTFALLTYFASQNLHKVFLNLALPLYARHDYFLGRNQASHARPNVIL